MKQTDVIDCGNTHPTHLYTIFNEGAKHENNGSVIFRELKTQHFPLCEVIHTDSQMSNFNHTDEQNCSNIFLVN